MQEVQEVKLCLVLIRCNCFKHRQGETIDRKGLYNLWQNEGARTYVQWLVEEFIIAPDHISCPNSLPVISSCSPYLNNSRIHCVDVESIKEESAHCFQQCKIATALILHKFAGSFKAIVNEKCFSLFICTSMISRTNNILEI